MTFLSCLLPQSDHAMPYLTIYSLFQPARIVLTWILCIHISMITIAAQEKLSKTEQQKQQVDAIFTQYEQAGFNTADTIKYIYHFSDRDRIPIIELSKALEKESIETISYFEKDKRWHLTTFENTVYNRQSMLEKEKEFRWMMYKYKVDNYHGFKVAEADINIAAVPSDQFLPFIISLESEDLFRLGLRLDKVKDYHRSLFVSDELVKRNFKPDTSYYMMGNALIGTHEYVQGIERWKKAVELNPDYLDVHMALGKIFFENSHWREAHRQFLEAYRINPNDDVIMYHLAKSMIKVERYKEAYTIIRRAVKVNPDNIYAKGVLKDMKSPGMKKLRKQSVY